MEDFKYLLNPSSINNTLFFKIETQSLINNETIDEEEDWYDFMRRRYNNYSEVNNKELLNNMRTKYHAEYSRIIAISYGINKTDINGVTTKEIRIIKEDDEKKIIEVFFKILEIFRTKKLDGLLCGYNILIYDIPFLIKRALKYNIKIPKSFKNNLTAKPWEFTIIDIINIWKFNGSDYCDIDMICKFLDIKTKYSLNNINDDSIDVREYLIEYVNIMIEIYVRLREM